MTCPWVASEVHAGSKAGAIAVLCGMLRRVIPFLKTQCHCRRLKIFLRRQANLFMLVPTEDFSSHERCGEDVSAAR